MPSKKKQSQKPIWKVHIAYNVHEKERILDPIFEHLPNSLYYFHFDDGNRVDVHLSFRDHNLGEVKKRLPDCEIHEIGINYVDYYQIISELARIINQEAKDHPEMQVKFKINLGSGSKMVAIANIDAHRLWDNIEIIYPYSEVYDLTADATHQGTIKVADPPKFEFKHPERLLIQALQIIYTIRQKPDKFDHMHEYVKANDLLGYFFDVYHLLEVKENDEPRKYDSSQRTKLRRNILDKLEAQWGFITITKVGRDNRIFFTEKGEKMAKVFINYDYGIDLTQINS